MVKKYKLAVLNSCPTRYQAPFFGKLAQHPKIDLMVYFCVDYRYGYDNHSLEGYKYKFLRNFSPLRYSFTQTKPGIIIELIKNRYDAILIYGYDRVTCWLAFLGALLTRIPILLIGVSILTKANSNIIKKLRPFVLRFLFKFFSAFLTVGKWNTKYYKEYGIPNYKIFSVPYPVDNEFFRDKYKQLSVKKKQLKEERGLNLNSPIILQVARLIPLKRPLDLLKAFQPLQNKAQLVFVGEGPEKSLLKDYIRKNKIKNVFFAGFKDRKELPIYYAMADIFVLPSSGETWGSVINEAMNFKLPIITTDNVGSAPDLIQEGKNGYIYKVGDITTLSKHLLRLLKNPKLIKKMGEKSYEIISKWSFDKDVEGIIKAMDYIFKS